MSETKKILVTDFVNNYNSRTSDKLKSDYITSIMKRNYCPILEKKMILNLMLEKSVTEDEIPTIDMFVNKLNFYAAIISLYTYIVPDKDENGIVKSYEMYDLLVENDLINQILGRIGERELGELTSINGLLLDNWCAKNTSTEAYVNNIIDTASRRFGISLELLLDKLTDILEDDAKTKKVTTILEKLAKKIK